ncbi:MAG: integrase core domain-containing protein [Candidatus Omnitrophota bacterium]|nr:integrase core domain-containing protein [Candidatus Omnitrophota bacterium]
MNDSGVVYSLRKKIFDDWRLRRFGWREVKYKYGFSRKWFYKWLGRYLRDGDKGLENVIRKKPLMPHRLKWDQELRILDYVYDKPTHGPERIGRGQVPRVSTKAVWNYLVRENLNTRRKRRLWAQAQGKSVLTHKEKQHMQAKYNHIEAKEAGELVGMDTFVVSVRGLGKLCQYTACDNYSSYGWAKIYTARTADNAVDFFVNHMFNNTASFKIRRILTDQGIEFYCARHKNNFSYFRRMLNRCGVEHTVTKKAHPWTNGYAERLNQTIWQDFYLCLLPKPYTTLEQLNEDLQKFMVEYNFKRRHTGYKLKAGGFEFPGHAFFDIREKSNIIEIKY